MKYRYLTFQELDLLSEDFSEFLYQRGTNKFEWNVLQDQQSEDALDLLEKYSEQTFEKVLQDIQYLNYRSTKEIASFQFKPEKMVVIRISAVGQSNIDLRNLEGLDQLKQKGLLRFKCAKSINSYTGYRETDIFHLMESGCVPADHQLFETLNVLRKAYEN